MRHPHSYPRTGHSLRNGFQASFKLVRQRNPNIFHPHQGDTDNNTTEKNAESVSDSDDTHFQRSSSTVDTRWAYSEESSDSVCRRTNLHHFMEERGHQYDHVFLHWMCVYHHHDDLIDTICGMKRTHLSPFFLFLFFPHFCFLICVDFSFIFRWAKNSTLDKKL